MLNKTLGILVTILLLFSACKDEDSPLSSTKQLNSFSILKGDNQGKIGNDVNALIVGNVLTLSMNKYDDLKSLVATFEYDGKSITVDGIEQESGVTLNDYSQPLAFIIEAEDGSKETYTVKVVLEEKAGFTSFRFLKKNNSFLTADATCLIEGNKIVSLYEFPQSKLVAEFSSNAVKVLVDEVEQVVA